MTNDRPKPGYKQTEVGVIPEDWLAKTFDDVVTGFSSGSTPSRTRPEFFKGDIVWITGGELDYQPITQSAEKLTQEAVQKSNLRIYPANTFVMGITGLEAEKTRGSCAITGVEATMSQQCMALLPKPEFSVRYLFHYYVAFGKKLALEYCQGTKQQSYSSRIVKILPIAVPPTVEEQETISQALSDVDALIAALEKAIGKKRAIKTATMQQLLTGKKRLPGFVEGKGYQQTAIGVLPEDWEVKAVGEVCDFIVPGRNKPRIFKGDIPWITTPDLEDGRGISKSKLGLFVSRYEAKSVGSRVVPTGSVLMSCVGELGIVALVEREIVINQQLHAFLPSKTVDSTFLLNVLQTQKEYMLSIATITAVPYLNKDNCNSIPIPLPQPPEQRAIATVLSDMDAAIAALETRLAKTQSIKQGMMQQLLTGKVRLKIEVSMNAGREDD